MRVLLLNNIYYRKGGSEAVFFNTAVQLKKLGHEVRFFSISGPNNELCEESSFFAPRLHGLQQIPAYFYNVWAARSLEKLLKVWKPDIAHVHLIWGGLSPSVIDILHKYEIPVVHTVHDYRLVCPAYTFLNNKGEICEKCRQTYLNCITNRCCKGSAVQSVVMALEMRYRNLFHCPINNIDGFVFVSNFCLNKHIEHDKQYANIKSVVLHNCTEVINSKPSSGYFLFSGRLSHEKGCYNLVRAFMQNPNLKLVIAGTGPEEAKMKEFARNLKNISFTGHLDKKSLFKLVSECSYVVVPSEWYENNPMSIIESYAASKPVIASKIGGIPEIVSDGKTGFLFAPGNLQSLSNVLKKCPADNSSEYKRLCSNAIKYYRDEFSEESYVSKLELFYKTVINEY